MLRSYPKESFIPSPQHRLNASPQLSAHDAARLLRYSFRQVKSATNNFSSSHLLGEGRSAIVYKGELHKRTVAIKKLKHPQRFGFREFKAEINAISRLRHRNILSLIGFCFNGEERILAYEFAANNSVAYHLEPGRKEHLDWKTRKKIILGTAAGLAYLHNDCKPGIVHLSITAASVLLDSEFQAKVTCFRNAESFLDPSATHQRTHVIKETFGYLDKRYQLYGDFNFKTDVYSLGILLLELITGVKVTPVSRGTGISNEFKQAIRKLVKAMKEKEFDDLVDPCLPKDYDYDTMSRMVLCATASICQSEYNRPTMQQIVQVLEGARVPNNFIKQKIIPPFQPNEREIDAPLPPNKQEINAPLPPDEQQISSPSPFSTAQKNIASTSSTASGQDHKYASSFSERIAIGPQRYTLQELEDATNNFSSLNIIGRGGFSTVYKGDLGNGTVAIKKLNNERRSGDFKAEINAVSRVSHGNLNSLVGYCIDGEARLLVYEFAANGSLADHLTPGRRKNLDWETRKKIILGTAKGLAYLHDSCNPRIIHRDIKPANVLLDFDFEAKVGDFGVAKLYPNSFDTHITTSEVGGTIGYVDPHCFYSATVSSKSDVYSFGILVLVLFTGQESFKDLEEVKSKLKTALRKKKFDDLADEYLRNVNDLNGMIRMTACAAVSILPSPNNRPTMEEIVDVMRGVKSPNDFIKKYVGKRKLLTFGGYTSP